jgi:myoferlin
MGGWSPSEKIYHLYKRRRWVRNRSIIDLMQTSQMMTSITLGEQVKSSNLNKKIKSSFLNFEKKKIKEIDVDDGWEYSKLFSTKFHLKEATTDSVRRRRWHRPMQPIVSDENIDLTAVFQFKSSQKEDGDVAKDSINLNAPRMFLKYKTSNKYQLRAYIYQARSLLAGDNDTSLSGEFKNKLIFFNFFLSKFNFQNRSILSSIICPTKYENRNNK